MTKKLRSPCETCAVEPGSIYCENCPGLKAYLEASKAQPADPDQEPEGTDTALAPFTGPAPFGGPAFLFATGGS